MKLLDYTAEDLLLNGLLARDREECISRLCEHLQRQGRIEDPAALTKAILKREEVESTAIGGGIALPHVRSEQVKGAVVAIAQLAGPIDFDAADDAPVDLVFLLLGSRRLPGQHLRVLARVSKLMHDREFLRGMREARSVEAMHESLRAGEERLD